MTLQNREEIGILVRAFYKKVRKDLFIGPIFNNQISDWELHQEKLTDFWYTNLHFEKAYKGNPGRIHIEVDQKYDQKVTQEHFGKWLQLWFETVDELSTGILAENAKMRARNMSTGFFLKMFKSRDVKKS
mgnify:CR=1 FL=1|tara:strand:- start:4965 stop:5354 length:390 start_codon:yes stop_codon:yes gene_type:complete